MDLKDGKSSATAEDSSPPVIQSESDIIPEKDVGERAEETEQKNDASPRDVHGIRWFLVVVSLLSSTFFFGLDNTVVADLQPALVERFGSVDRLPWLSVAFLIGAASTNFF